MRFRFSVYISGIFLGEDIDFDPSAAESLHSSMSSQGSAFLTELIFDSPLNNNVLKLTLNDTKECNDLYVQTNLTNKINYLILEKSYDGITYSILSDLTNNQSNNYKDCVELNNIVYYRLKGGLNNGQLKYSNVVVTNKTIEFAEIQIFPNPASTTLNVFNNIQADSIVIYNIQGVKVFEGKLNNGNTIINIESLIKGYYKAVIYKNSKILDQLNLSIY